MTDARGLRSRLIALADGLLQSPRARRLLRDFYYRCRGIAAGLSGPSIFDTLRPKPDPAPGEVGKRLASARASRAQPVCSVIIPAFNKSEFTCKCLGSILMAEVATPYEVIVVDDASTDGTGNMLAEFDGWARVLRNDANGGFVSACNRGAGAARGGFLVFLNNDTEVTDGWLDRLGDTFRERPDAGAVGAKLVYPDGLLQEAGGIIWRDGSAANYGNRDNPALFKYNFLREVDYCSAACLMVRKDVFDRLGGFDGRYSPAYYEDVDLCFNIRSLGYKVFYQPASEILHYEGATAGKEVTVGPKAYQEINRVKFCEKRHKELKGQYPRSLENIIAASDRADGPHLLFIDLQVPRYDQDTGSARMYEFMKILVHIGCRVTFLYRWRETPDSAPYCRELGRIGIRVIHEKDVFQELSSGEFHLVFLSRLHVAEFYLHKIKKAARGIPVVFDTVDLNFVREARRAEVTGDRRLFKEADALKKRELAVACSCALTIAITGADREHLLADAPGLDVSVISTVMKPPENALLSRAGKALMFIGGFRHQPNADAMVYFAKEILPLIRRKLGAELLIVGSHPTPEVLALASGGITVTGYVPEVAPYYARSRVFVCPLRYGSGMKGKIGEALSYGVPVVTTSVGAEGMGLVDGETAFIRDDPEAFAEAVCALYEDDALRLYMAEKGRDYIRENFSPEAVRGKLSIIAELAEKYRQTRKG